ncbi:hypothetical protein KUTeg_020126 [Tegillarca granosa]|uniref:Uncharacterized protein n=1 Tax=Tegillarca granosa TaxID=220873 RepID=A0ABQ9E9M1_TEGGR|nr:hypothetical protein KUTeg_020126 [Tegillarca granosa]
MAAVAAPLSMVYRSDQQHKQLGQVLHEFLKNGEFCDIKLLVGSAQINVHKVILAAFSPYFYQILQQNVSLLTLHNFDERAVRSVIDFCYTGTIMVDTVSAEKLLPLAQTLQIREVEKLCRTFLTAQQSLTGSEISPNRRHHFPTGIRNREENETVEVESSGRFSPRASPSVSTSGRPSSEAGSVENTDLEVISIKTEVSDEFLTDQYIQQKQKSRSGSKLRDDEPQISQMSPVSFRPPSGYNRPPPQLQLISQWKDTKCTGSSYDGTPRLQLISPHRGSSYVHTEPSPELLLMSQPKDSSAEQKSSLPLPQTQQKESLYSNSEVKSGGNIDSLDPSQDNQSSQLSDMLMCRVCHQVFTSSDSLKSHMKIHTQTWPKKTSKLQQGDIDTSSKNLFTCGTCGKYFKDSQALKFHRYNHILRFPCNLCGRRFSRSWNLLRHKKTHYKSDEFVSIDSSYLDSPNVSTSNDQLFTSSSTENEYIMTMSSVHNDPTQTLSSSNNSTVLESSVDLTTEMDTGEDENENRGEFQERENENKDVAKLLS